MTVGLGTGTTVAYLLPALAAARSTSGAPRTEHAARELGLKVEGLEDIEHFDVTIDGADQVIPDGWLVKGGGAAHTDRGASAVVRPCLVARKTWPVVSAS